MRRGGRGTAAYLWLPVAFVAFAAAQIAPSPYQTERLVFLAQGLGSAVAAPVVTLIDVASSESLRTLTVAPGPLACPKVYPNLMSLRSPAMYWVCARATCVCPTPLRPSLCPWSTCWQPALCQRRFPEPPLATTGSSRSRCYFRRRHQLDQQHMGLGRHRGGRVGPQPHHPCR